MGVTLNLVDLLDSCCMIYDPPVRRKALPMLLFELAENDVYLTDVVNNANNLLHWEKHVGKRGSCLTRLLPNAFQTGT